MTKRMEVMDGVLMDLEQELDVAKQDVERLTAENEALRQAGGGAGGGESELHAELEQARADSAKYKQKLDLLRVEYKKLSRQVK